jgi:hypothetical protein
LPHGAISQGFHGWFTIFCDAEQVGADAKPHFICRVDLARLGIVMPQRTCHLSVDLLSDATFSAGVARGELAAAHHEDETHVAL